MKNLLVSILLFTALFVCFSCSKPAPAPTKFSLERPFALTVGQTGTCADVVGFEIRFDRISSDSRCPQGTQCVTAGKADVVLTLTKAGDAQTATLPFTLPNGTSNVMDFKGHTVRVLGVSPFKFQDKEIKPEEYSVVLSVIDSTAQK